MWTSGPLYGSSSQNVTAFRGLRYGVAPLKQRRWRPAEAAPCVSGKALEDGSSCLQGGGAGESEDSDFCDLSNGWRVFFDGWLEVVGVVAVAVK